MSHNKISLFLALGCLLVVALACNYSFTTANISSLKITKEKGSTTDVSTFDSKDTVYVAAVISNTSDKHKVTGRLLFDDVKGQESGKPVPGGETTLDVPGAATATFTFAPPSSGWLGGKYKIEVTMKNDDGKQIDQKTATLSVSGTSSSDTAAGNTDSGATQSTVKLASVVLDSQMEGEPDGSKATFSPDDTIYVFYTIQGATPATKIYCNLYAENAEGVAPNTLLRALSYLNPPNSDIIDRFDLVPKKEAEGQTAWARGTYRLEISYVTDKQTSSQVLKTLKLTVQ